MVYNVIAKLVVAPRGEDTIDVNIPAHHLKPPKETQNPFDAGKTIRKPKPLLKDV